MSEVGHIFTLAGCRYRIIRSELVYTAKNEAFQYWAITVELMP